MSSTLRPDNLKAALHAKLAAAQGQLMALHEAEQPCLTPHLSPRQIVISFMGYAGGVYAIADAFGRAEVGELQFNAWYEQWMRALNNVDRALVQQVRHHAAHHGQADATPLVEVEISVDPDPSVTVPNLRHGVRKQLARFATQPERPASDVCEEYLRVTKQFAGDFVRDHDRFLK